MARRQLGTVTKITVDPALSEVFQVELPEGEPDPLGEPIPEEKADSETVALDEVLIASDSGGNLVPENAPAKPAPPRCPTPRADSSPRIVSKFNRHTGMWE